MFKRSAHLYDVIYTENVIYTEMGKDYAAEAEKVHALIQQYKKSPGNHLLDVACGTGLHLATLRDHYQVEGLDLDENMVEAARQKFPAIPFHAGDMVDFKLNQRFDALTCLFSSIGYVRTLPRLRKAVATMAKHLLPGGVLLVEPWFSPETWNSGKPHALFVDRPDLKIARMNISSNKGTLSYFDFHYLVATPEGIEHFTELHELGLFTTEEYLDAFQRADLDVHHDPVGLDGRGLFIGLKKAV